MTVAVVSAVYPPEPVVSGRTSADIAAALHAKGERVTVICPFPSRPAGALHPGFRRRWRTTVDEGGITVVRTFSTLSTSSTLISRFAENLTFGISAFFALLRVPGLRAVYLNTWPIFATGLAVLAARMKGARYVISVQDVYPESLFVQRRRGAAILGGILRAIDRWVVKRASAVIVLSEHFASIYRDDRRVPPERIHVIPNWIAEDVVRVDPEAGRTYRRGRGIPDDAFLVGYGGNISVAAAVEQLIEAWRHIDDPHVHLLIAGSGPRAAACETLARSIAPERIHFHTPWPAEETTPVLNAADLLALPTLGDQSLISVPSKLLSYLLAARPVVAAAHPQSETAKAIAAGTAGWSIPPGDARALAEAILAAARLPVGEREALGTSARRYGLATFGRDRCTARVLALLDEA